MQIISGDWNFGLITLEQLPVVDCEVADFKSGLAKHQVEFPHAAKRFAARASKPGSVVLKTPVPLR